MYKNPSECSVRTQMYNVYNIYIVNTGHTYFSHDTC